MNGWHVLIQGNGEEKTGGSGKRKGEWGVK